MKTIIVLTLLGVAAAAVLTQQERKSIICQLSPEQEVKGNVPVGDTCASERVVRGPAPQQSRKVIDAEDVKIPRSSAHALIKRHKRAYDYYERFYPRIKPPMEVKKEQCENYWPCDQLSEWVGFHQAYQTYFGRV